MHNKFKRFIQNLRTGVKKLVSVLANTVLIIILIAVIAVLLKLAFVFVRYAYSHIH